MSGKKQLSRLVTEEQFLKTYFELGEFRSVIKAYEAWKDVPGYVLPPYNTMRKWSERHRWKARADEHDEAIRSGAQMMSAHQGARNVYNASQACLDTASHCHRVVVAALNNLDPLSLKPAEIKMIGELGIEMVKMREVLIGGVSDRQATEATATLKMAQTEAISYVDKLLEGVKNSAGKFEC